MDRVVTMADDVARRMSTGTGTTTVFTTAAGNDGSLVLRQNSAATRLRSSDEILLEREKKKQEAVWDIMFQSFIDYRNNMSNGSLIHEPSITEDPELAAWLRKQRQDMHAFRYGKLSEKNMFNQRHIDLLNAIGFDWTEPEWDRLYHDLEGFKEKHGHCNVPFEYENRELAIWVKTQRENKTMLDMIGFQWAEGKHAEKRSAADSQEDNHPRKRALKRNDNDEMDHSAIAGIDNDDTSLLESIDGETSLRKSWEEHFQRLVKYKKDNGNTRVPRIYAADQKLALWVEAQQRNRRMGKLTESEIYKLNSIGFEWTAQTRLRGWEQMFQQLIEFQKKEGHTNVPRRKGEDPKLALWVDTQRRYRKLNKLSEDKIERLNSIGFEWNAHVEKWEAMFQKLVGYKDTFGHARVPQEYAQDRKLGEWVRTQRRFMRNGSLNEEKVARLNSVGFEWSVSKGPAPASIQTATAAAAVTAAGKALIKQV